MIRNPSSRRAITARVNESRRPTRGATRAATLKVPLAASESATRSPNRVVVPSTTTIRSGPPEPANRSGRKNRVAKKIGPRAADTQNHLLRTRSTNSRRMTAQTLRTGGLAFRAHYGSRRFRPHQVDEDLVQRRLHQLEPREPGTGGYESLQDHLRVCPRRELELGELPVVVHLLHQTPVGKDLLRGAGAAVESDDEMVSAMYPLDVRERAVHQLPAPRDDAQLLAQLFGLLHDVGREQDRLPAAAQVEHGVLHHLSIDGIEPRERLVDNQEIRVVEHGRDELHLLLHSLRQLVDPAQSPLSEPESLEPLPGPLARPPPVDAFHFAKKHEHVEHPHLAVQAALLREIADPLRVGPPAARLGADRLSPGGARPVPQDA